MSYDFLFRIIVIGDTQVGKTSLCHKLTDDKFLSSCESTIGVDFSSLRVTLSNNIILKCQLWDTAGCERFRSITKSYYTNTAIVILVFDLSEKSSFYSLNSWVKEISQNMNASNYKILLIGNKVDQERKIKFETVYEFANNHRMTYLETSAKNDIQLYDKFKNFLEDIYQDSQFISTCKGIKHMNKKTLSIQKERDEKVCYCCNIS